ncbi:MAG TPA: MmcQ/YjbR family DNA-binding protein [Vicinamibacterales bacterium]|jgi:predicted DNA-binding protein (MmcQ/YjbR family)
MRLESLRTLCLALPDATEDIKWGQDLAFSIRKKMFCVVNTEPPHQMSFKCSPEDFAELIERSGMRPAPYLARAMWVLEEQLGASLDASEVQKYVTRSYDLVAAKAPGRKRTSKRPSSGRTRKSAARRAKPRKKSPKRRRR